MMEAVIVLEIQHTFHAIAIVSLMNWSNAYLTKILFAQYRRQLVIVKAPFPFLQSNLSCFLHVVVFIASWRIILSQNSFTFSFNKNLFSLLSVSVYLSRPCSGRQGVITRRNQNDISRSAIMILIMRKHWQVNIRFCQVLSCGELRNALQAKDTDLFR